MLEMGSCTWHRHLVHQPVRHSHLDSEQCGWKRDCLAEPHDCFDGTRRNTKGQEQVTLVWRRVVFWGPEDSR